jgi:hypothetical protein
LIFTGNPAGSFYFIAPKAVSEFYIYGYSTKLRRQIQIFQHINHFFDIIGVYFTGFSHGESNID